MSAGRWRWLTAWLGGAALYAWWIAPRINLPPLGDETFIAMRAIESPSALAAMGALPHPPLFMALLRAGVQWWGWSDGALRWVGVASFLVTMTLLGLLAERLHEGSGPWAMLLWAAHPLAIQGSLLLDIDNTLLTTLSVAVVLMCLWQPWPLTRGQRWWLTALWCAGLWTKFASLLILGAPLLVAWWSSPQPRRHFAAVAQIVGVGSGVFALGWWWFLQQLPPTAAAWDAAGHTWRAMTQHAWQTSPGAGLQIWGTRFLRLGLWWVPWSVPLTVGALLVWRTTTGALRWRLGVLAGTVLLVGIGYAIIGGTTYSFPRYHVPLLPLAIVAWVVAARQALPPTALRTRWSWHLGLLLAAAVATWAFGDFLYTLNVGLRHVSVTAPAQLPSRLAQFAISLVGWSAVGAGLWWYWARRAGGFRMPAALLGGILLLTGTAVATDVQQRRAPYATTYCYGRSYDDFARISHRVAALRNAQPEMDLFVPVDIAHAVGITEAQWNQRPHEALAPAAFRQELMQQVSHNPQVLAVVISEAYHSAGQLRVVQEPDVQDALRRAFIPETVGEYVCWVRKGVP